MSLGWEGRGGSIHSINSMAYGIGSSSMYTTNENVHQQ